MRIIKKIVLAIIVLISVVVSGCQKDDGLYEVFQVGDCAISDGGKHSSELVIWSGQLSYHQDTSAPENAVVTFNGITYAGNYRWSTKRVPLLDKLHQYIAEEEGIVFEINSETGEMGVIQFMQPIKEAATVDGIYCRQVADSIAESYINLDEYEISEEIIPLQIQHIAEPNFYYKRTYCRKLDGYATTDCISIRLDGNGHIRECYLPMLGSFADVKSVSVNKTKVKKAIQAKLDIIYNGNATLENYEINEGKLIRLEDGTCAVWHTVSVDTNSGGGVLDLVVTVPHKKW